MKGTRDSLTQADATPWLAACDGGIVIELHVQPGARHEGLVGEHGGRLKLALRSPALEGRASAALLRWLGERLRMPQAAFTLVRGTTSRVKRVQVLGIDPATAQARLAKAKKKEQP